MKTSIKLAALLAAIAWLPAQADEQAVRAALETLVPGVKIDSIADAPMPGYAEVVLSGQILYVSDDGKYLIQGSVFDIAKRADLTENSRAGARKSLLASIEAGHSIVFAPEKPDYTVTVFTDIDCAYCRRLHQQIADYNRLGIAVRYLFFPRAGLGSDSYDKAVSVWCADDQRAALTQAKAGEVPPKRECSNPVAEDFELGQRVGVSGTPAIYTAQGVQIGGYVPPEQMRQRLDQLAGKPAAPKTATAGG